jgi:hypothetical protein
MVEENDNDLDFITSFKKKTSETSKVRKDFQTFMDASLLDLSFATKTLVNENSTEFIVGEMNKINIRTTSEAYIARLQFLLTELAENSEVGVKLYYDFFVQEYDEEAMEATWTSIDDRVKAIRKDDPKATLPQEIIDEYYVHKAYTERRKLMLATIKDLLMEGVWGDQTLDDSNMAGVYFQFPAGLDEALTTLFIKEIRRIQSDAISKIQKVVNYVNSTGGTTILFFFEKEEEAMTFFSTKMQLEAIYDKYLRYTQQNAKIELKWDLIQTRYAEFINANLPHTDPRSGMYVDPNAPVPVSPPAMEFDDEDEEIDLAQAMQPYRYANDDEEDGEEEVFVSSDEAAFGVQVTDNLEVVFRFDSLDGLASDTTAIFGTIDDFNEDDEDEGIESHFHKVDEFKYQYKDGYTHQIGEAVEYLLGNGFEYNEELNKFDNMSIEEKDVLMRVIENKVKASLGEEDGEEAINPSDLVFFIVTPEHSESDYDVARYFITTKAIWREYGVEAINSTPRLPIDQLMPIGFGRAVRDQVADPNVEFRYTYSMEKGKAALEALGMTFVYNGDGSEPEDKGLSVFPEDAIFGISTNNEAGEIRFVLTNKEHHYFRNPKFDTEFHFLGIDDNTAWSRPTYNEHLFGGDFKAGYDFLISKGLEYEPILNDYKNEADEERVVTLLTADEVEEAEVVAFVDEQYNKVVNVWRKNPERFSVIRTESGLRLVNTADFEYEDDFEENSYGLLSDLYAELVFIRNQEAQTQPTNDLHEFAVAEREKIRRWKKSPSKFSVIWNGSAYKTKETAELKGTEDVKGTVEELSR